jgi:hypothetical protein
MASNLDRFKKDLDAMIERGTLLEFSMKRACNPAAFDGQIKKAVGTEAPEFLKKLPRFSDEYQRWYSEALALLRQILPDRVSDFVRHYEKPKPRKELTNENYRIEDFLQGLSVTHSVTQETVVDRSAAIPHFNQQLAIVQAAKARFESSLFEIRQLVQADLLDSELDAARELAENKFTRAAGAVAGVVLERHLGQVCEDHKVKVSKKNPGISDLNELLKAASVIDVPQWRFIQHLADIRNLCDHSKTAEPTAEQVEDLIGGVAKVTKTIY